MAFCTNCGHEVPGGVKFCANCGATIEIKNSVANSGIPTQDFEINNESFERYAMGNLSQNEPPKKTWIDKFSKFFGIILMIIAFVDFQSDPPALTIILSIAIIAGAIFCLSQKYKLKGFTIIALILAIFCLIAGINQGKRMGFFKISSDSDYSNSSIETVIDETPVVEKETKEEVISKEPEVEVEETEEKNEAKSENGVDPDLKAFLDSYEEFVDEYVVFMKKYMADPSNAISMLSEYTKIMEKYEDFAEKVDKYDSNSMSTEDAKYYLEVTNRCTQKMLDIY